MIIVESPSKCKQISLYSGLQCLPSIGHVRCLESVDDGEPTYKLLHEKHVQKMKKEIKHVDKNDIILGTDNDREGEAIAWHLCVVLNLPLTTKRIVFNEITKSAIQHAMSNPRMIDMNVVMAQQCRQILDYKIGYSISPHVWNHTGNRKLSAGRCQVPTLRIVYDHKVTPTFTYQTTAYCTKHNLPFTTTCMEDPLPFLNLSKSHAYDYTADHSVVSCNPPNPLNTARVLKTMNYKHNTSPSETMNQLQLLYEEGKITYMRTDSTTYSEVFLQALHPFIQTNYGVCPHTPDGVHGPHEAIRPTNLEVRSVDGKNKRLYELIWRTTVESCMPPATYDLITCKLNAPMEYEYTYSCRTIRTKGWDFDATPNPTYLFLSHVTKIEPTKIISRVIDSSHHKHLSEGDVIRQLEKHGIGRPSTYASLLDKIQERGYVKLQNIQGTTKQIVEHILEKGVLKSVGMDKVFGAEKNKLVIQPVGVGVIEYLNDKFRNLFAYDYSKQLEEQLDQVEKGDLHYKDVCKIELPDPPVMQSGTFIGIYEKEEIRLHHGKFGYYVTWCNKNIAFKHLTKRDEKNITYDYVVSKLKDPSLIRRIDADTVIRIGKFGVYIQTPQGNVNLKNFKHDYLTCDTDHFHDYISNHNN
jgi:DNA topoisomerase-1